jgi:hypothetical protein
MLPSIFCLLAALAASAPHSTAVDARALVTRAIDALGGEAALKSLAALRIESIGHDDFIDQSDRPEGPFIVRYLQTTELRDVNGARSRVDSQQRDIQVPAWSPPVTTVVDRDAAALVHGDKSMPAGRQAFEDGRERIDLAPERVLFAALAAGDLRVEPDVKVHGIVQQVVSFGWRNRRVRLLFDSGDGVPTALETISQDVNGIWGLVRQTTYYSLWTLLPGGVRYPLQLDHEWNGVSRGSSTIMKLDVNPAIEASEFAISPETKAAFAALPAVSGIPSLSLDPSKRREVAPGITQYAGSWNVEIVQQPDGIVVIEAPVGSRYSAEVLDEIATRYPDARIKALVTTSDAWPHLGGVREYVARGIPVYALDLNQPILERLLKADYSPRPDALATAAQAGKFTWVSGKTVIGTGDTRIELYPAHGENGERQMFAYFPALKLLYTSDDVQPMRNGTFFMPAYLIEVRDAARREHLEVDRIFGFHAPPTPWSAIEAAISSASASSAPGGR